MRTSLVVAASCSALLLMAGCEQRLGDFTFLSSKNIDLLKLEMEAPADARIVEGEDSKPIVFLFSGGAPNLKEAVDRAIESGQGTALTDVSIYQKGWYIPYIVGENAFRVRGKVVR